MSLLKVYKQSNNQQIRFQIDFLWIFIHKKETYSIIDIFRYNGQRSPQRGPNDGQNRLPKHIKYVYKRGAQKNAPLLNIDQILRQIGLAKFICDSFQKVAFLNFFGLLRNECLAKLNL